MGRGGTPSIYKQHRLEFKYPFLEFGCIKIDHIHT